MSLPIHLPAKLLELIEIAELGPGQVLVRCVDEVEDVLQYIEMLFKCYCFCDVMGHTDLRWCFLKEGDLAKEFDDHGSGCNICYGQAMMAFLWQDVGIPPEKMVQGFEKRFEKLIEKINEGNRS